MKSKSFSLYIILGFIISFLSFFFLMILAYTVFAPNWKTGLFTGGEVCYRELKTRYISQENCPYNSFILGGSKAGFLQPKTFNYYNKNKQYYNFYTSNGLFSNYECYSRYLIATHNDTIKEIVIHLSSYETNSYYDSLYVPIQMQENVLLKTKSLLTFIKERYLNITFLKNLFLYFKTGKTSINSTGEINAIDSITLFEKDNDSFIKQNVLHSFIPHLRKLFYSEPQLRFYTKDIEALKRIKQYCDKNHINLKVTYK